MRKRLIQSGWIVLFFSPVIAGCEAGRSTPATGGDPMVSVNTLLSAPDDFARKRIGSDEFPIPPWAKHLKGVKIALDPGHGGDAEKRGFKRGPTGVREAEMNLRLAQYVRDFLVASGAEVRLTREDDHDLSLKDRAGVANDWPADIFVSLHHNAIDNKPEVNYTTVWYHETVDYRPSSLDLARHLCDGLHDALRLPKYADVPLKSDQLMYASGFGVLGNCRVTCALCECSFYTNPDEEQRLRRPEYTLREAYGIFQGLARYAADGLPRAELVDPANGEVSAGGSALLTFRLDDGLRGRKAWGHARQMILSDSITVKLDGRRAPFQFKNDGYQLLVEVPAGLAAGRHGVQIQFMNMYKNSSIQPEFAIFVRGEPAGTPMATGMGQDERR